MSVRGWLAEKVYYLLKKWKVGYLTRLWIYNKMRK